MQETEATSPAEPFLQGDIIEIVADGGHSSHPPLGIVINADCDLAHCKVDGVIAYVPLFPFHVYFQKFWIPAYIDSRRQELLDQIAQRLPQLTDIKLQICSWLKEESAVIVAEKLSSVYSVRNSEIYPKLEELLLIETAENFNWALFKSVASISGALKSNAMAAHVKRAMKNMGDGHIIFNEIHGRADLGFVARMRRIYSLDLDCVFSSYSDFMSRKNYDGVFGVRISKLTTTFRFKVAQLFVQQFSRIGLPDDITKLNELAVQAAMSDME